MTKSKKMIIGTLPFVALIVLFAIFCGIVSSKGYRLDMYIKIVFNEGIVLSIVATGAYWMDDTGYHACRNWMLFTEFGSGINISYSGLCYNSCYDVCFVSYCITDYYDKRWCGRRNKHSECSSKVP